VTAGPSTIAWAAGGAATGALHAVLLARAAGGRSGAGSAVLRLLLAATVLSVAASRGRLLVTTVAWCVGLLATAAVLYVSLSPRRSR